MGSYKKILHTNIWSSELAKLTANAFLAQKLVLLTLSVHYARKQELTLEKSQEQLVLIVVLRSKFLESGPGFGGSCFKKDILNLVYLAEFFGLPEVARFWNEVVRINKCASRKNCKSDYKETFPKTISGKKIVVLGFAFKCNTNDTRESAIQICKDLIDEGKTLYS